MSIISFNHVSKIYHQGFFRHRTVAVSDLSFSIEEPGIIGFVGPNGAGKTTSIKMLLGMVHPTAGKILVRNNDAQKPGARKGIGFVSEQPYFYSHLTVEESLGFVQALRGEPICNLSKEIDRVLAKVDLASTRRRKINQLSKGMQQRLTMAHALLGSPALYIMDEPMSGLDPVGRKLFRSLLIELKKSGKCVFFSTHIIEDIELLCDQIIVLSKGSLKYAGEIKKLIDESNLGTEIVVSQLSEEQELFLTKKGCSCTKETDGACTIQVPNGIDVRQCQEYLIGSHIYPQYIQKSRMPLEAILYKSNKETDQ